MENKYIVTTTSQCHSTSEQVAEAFLSYLTNAYADCNNTQTFEIADAEGNSLLSSTKDNVVICSRELLYEIFQCLSDDIARFTGAVQIAPEKEPNPESDEAPNNLPPLPSYTTNGRTFRLGQMVKYKENDEVRMITNIDYTDEDQPLEVTSVEYSGNRRYFDYDWVHPSQLEVI